MRIDETQRIRAIRTLDRWLKEKQRFGHHFLNGGYIKRELPEYSKSAPPEIKTMIDNIESDLSEMEGFDNRRDERMFNAGVRAGSQFILLMAQVSRPRGDGRPEHRIYKYLRTVYSRDQKVKAASIVAQAIEEFKRDFPRGKHPKSNTLLSHFASKVKNSHR